MGKELYNLRSKGGEMSHTLSIVPCRVKNRGNWRCQETAFRQIMTVAVYLGLTRYRRQWSSKIFALGN